MQSCRDLVDKLPTRKAVRLTSYCLSFSNRRTHQNLPKEILKMLKAVDLVSAMVWEQKIAAAYASSGG